MSVQQLSFSVAGVPKLLGSVSAVGAIKNIVLSYVPMKLPRLVIEGISKLIVKLMGEERITSFSKRLIELEKKFRE